MTRLLDDLGDSYWQRFEDRCRVRRLPEALRRQLRRVRNPYQLSAPLGAVRGRIDEIAERKGVVRATPDDDFRPHRYVPAIHLRQIHRDLMRDRTIVSAVQNEIDSALEDGNRDRRLPPNEYPRLLPDCRPPSSGMWSVRSDLGFGLGSQFEGKPEGFAVGIAQRVWDQALGNAFEGVDVGLAEDFQLAVLDWGSFGGMTTHALASTKPSYASLAVYENDVVGEPTDSPHAVPLGEMGDEQLFDLIVVTIPPPGAGGTFQYRNRYKTGDQRHATDMGTMGPARWRRGLQFVLRNLPPLLADRGELVLLVPESVRVERGYEAAPDLLDGLTSALGDQGLVVTHELQVVEMNPHSQPFVETGRPARRCIIARQPRPDDSARESE
jgi:hypothetical protein